MEEGMGRGVGGSGVGEKIGDEVKGDTGRDSRESEQKAGRGIGMWLRSQGDYIVIDDL